jgi:adenine-specific DNA-methyltransferase
MLYDDLTREQAVNLLIKRDATRKLGLYWERNEIEHDRALNADFVTMALDVNLSCSTAFGGPEFRNLVIEGDNFDALRWLRMTHRGQIKCIFIDPPYNTGKQDFVYNDRFVDKDDRFRQSMWLEFLYQRLSLARDLLRDDGVILVCINDDNRAKLELLMDEVFPGMRIGSFVWKSRIGGNDGGGAFFTGDHEHILAYGNSGFRFGGTAKSFSMYSNSDNDPRGDWRADNLTVSVRFDDKRAGNAFYPLHDPETGIWYPCNPNRVWAYASRSRLKPGQRTKTSTMEEFIEQGKILFPKEQRVQVWDSIDELLTAIDVGDVPTSGRAPLLRRGLPDLEFWVGKPVGWGTPAFKRHKRDLKHANQPLSSWIRPQSEKDDGSAAEVLELVSAFTDEGSKSIKDLFGEKVFNYPKPPSLLKTLLKQCADESDIVLDFFAGSGTTAQVVLELNAEDGGERRFIMVSSTEATSLAPDRNLCRDVCAERVRRIITGHGTNGARTNGIGGDFAYMRAAKVDFHQVSFRLTGEQVWNAVQALHGLPLRPYDSALPAQIVDDGLITVVYCDDVNEDVIETLTALDGPMIAYSWAPGQLRNALSDRAELRSVPQFLLQRFQG